MKKILIIIIFLFIFLLSIKIAPKNSKQDSKTIYLTIDSTKDIVEIELEEYIKGVIFAEMPSTFSLEALKAQAVAARTYAIKKIRETNHICTNPSHCQAWKYPNDSEYYNKISQAVYETKNEILTYLGEPIQAFFHSSSGGKTENSENVWCQKIPYLKSVESPNEDKIMKTFNTSKEIKYSELKKLINLYKRKEIINSSNLKNNIKILSRTPSNRIKEIKIQNCILSGNEIRNILNLRSTNFDIELKKDSIIFNVKGYGHGVGMSQYGAEVMAQDGKNYKDILYHYYPNTLIEKTS